MSSTRRLSKDPCWLVWETTIEGRMYLRAVDTEYELALAHKRMCENDRELYRPFSRFSIEVSELNHCFGLSLSQSGEYDFPPKEREE
jgi:hypothetical protein